MGNNFEIVKYLFESKADPKIANKDGFLFFLIFNFYFFIFYLRKGHNSLYRAICSDKVNMEIVKFLVNECDLDPNFASVSGDTCLTLSCFNQNSDLELVKFLVSKKGDPNIRNQQRNSPLHLSILSNPNKPEISKYLIENGGNVNLQGREGNYIYFLFFLFFYFYIIYLIFIFIYF